MVSKTTTAMIKNFLVASLLANGLVLLKKSFIPTSLRFGLDEGPFPESRETLIRYGAWP